jgi:hypothetical protein
MKVTPLCVILLIFSRPAFAQIEPAVGIDLSLLFSGSSNYGWELIGLYPFIGLQMDQFRLRAFGGAGISVKSEIDEGLKLNWYGTYAFGGNLDFFMDPWIFGFGGGMASGGIEEFEKPYPFARGEIGAGNSDAAIKLYYDYNFDDNGFKTGVLISITLWPKSSSSYTPPDPAPTPPPAPPRPQPAPPPPPGDNSGTIYYSYNGTGYVYISENVFYRCSDGHVLGYAEGGTIYAFNGKVLGFYENPFIYDKNGNPVGADDPKRLGTDAAAKRSVAKASKQDLPVKQPKKPVNRPRLKNVFRGDSLQDIF